MRPLLIVNQVAVVRASGACIGHWGDEIERQRWEQRQEIVYLGGGLEQLLIKPLKPWDPREGAL